ncbi:DHA2 family efflux MFS transporter permease subunit [Bacillus sp. PK3_68]|uniref:DHA2 family efflux MFS transporter permease subunit n=1 Tax=Bacillus sp. PK3_68 TaxID=2027408 RepID=UPI000E71280F|nr:DHA2 family efflux MFS transporter permease subunit [Bacillus sp. PK3_68]RJS60066.1 MFS transporter [Bacillus sp. PK3_68]
MASAFLIGYFILAVIVVAFVNKRLAAKRKKTEPDLPVAGKEMPQQSAIAVQQEDASQQTAVPEDIQQEAQEETNAEVAEEIYSSSEDAPPKRVGPVLAVLLFGMFVAILNQTLINVALPVMMSDFNVSTSTAQWLMTGFMLVNGIMIPISAFLILKYGFRKLFILSMISFTVGSIICAVSGTFTIMMVGRVIQAIGAGVLMPLGTNVFMTLFPPEKRGAAMGTMGIAMILAPAIGPTLTGWVIQHYEWNVMFYGMFILGVIDILLAIRLFHLKSETVDLKLDVFSLITSSIGFGGLLYGFSEAGNNGWDSAEVILSLIIGIISLAVFVWKQLVSETPMLNMNVFKFNMFTFTLIINSIITMALFGGMLLLPIYLQNIRGFTPMESGLLLLPGALIMGLMGPIAGKLFDKYGVRWLAVIGLAITTYGTFEFTHLTSDTPYRSILMIYILRSFGMSLIMMPIMTAGMNVLPMKLIAHGTAMSNTIRQVAGSIGTAFLVTIMTRQSTFHMADYENQVTTTNSFIQDKINSLSQAFGGGESGHMMSIMSLYSEGMKLSTIKGINDAFVVATILAAIAFILSFFLPSKKKAA